MHDWQLLREYVEQDSQTAFATLTERHANLVYATCLRELGDSALAEDVTQVVFIILARKAASLREGTVLAGWLFNTARFACKNALKQERRRQIREQRAVEQMTSEMQADKSGWANIEPLLHDGLATLAMPERDAVLLRFFEGRSLRDTGTALGISEDAARMRVARALDKLRRHFARHGFAVSVMALSALLFNHAAHAAPAACLTAASSIPAHLSSASVTTISPQVTALSQGVWRALLFKKIGVAAGLGVLLLGTGGAVSQFARRDNNRSVAQTGTRQLSTPASRVTTKQNPTPAALTPVVISTKPILPVIIEPKLQPKENAPRSITRTNEGRVTSNPTTRRINAQIIAPRVAPRTIPQVEGLPLATIEPPEVQPGAIREVPVAAAPPPIAAAPQQQLMPPEQTAPIAPATDSPITLPAPSAQISASAVAPKSAGLRPRKAAFKADLRGRVVAVNDSASSISIRVPGQGDQTFTVPPDAKILVNNQPATLDDIKLGMGAGLQIQNSDVAFVIRARVPQAKQQAARAKPLKLPKGGNKPKGNKKKQNRKIAMP